jgi:hypothetical protein
MYKVADKEFNTFQEVIEYAWNEHKISFEGDEAAMMEDDRQDACGILTECLKAQDPASEESPCMHGCACHDNNDEEPACSELGGTHGESCECCGHSCGHDEGDDHE